MPLNKESDKHAFGYLLIFKYKVYINIFYNSLFYLLVYLSWIPLSIKLGIVGEFWSDILDLLLKCL